MSRLPVKHSCVGGRSKPYNLLSSRKKPFIEAPILNIPGPISPIPDAAMLELTLFNLTGPCNTSDVNFDGIPSEPLLIDLTMDETPLLNVNNNGKEWIDSFINHGNFITLDGPISPENSCGVSDASLNTRSNASPSLIERSNASADAIPIHDASSTVERSVDEVTQRMKSVSIKEWSLGCGFYVALHNLNSRLYVHMHQYKPRDNSDSFDYAPTKQGIVMNLPTYLDFKDKIYNVNVVYMSSSVVCNNQLAVFSNDNNIVLQQIFHFEHYKFKNSSISIDYFNLMKLREIIPELNETIKSSVLYDILPNKILANVSETVVHTIDLESEYISVVHDEVETNVRKLFKCDACIISNPSQYKHACMMNSYEELCEYVGDDGLMSINVQRIINELQTRNVLHLFTSDFFKNGIDYDLFEKKLLM